VIVYRRFPGMNVPLEYLLVGVVALALFVYLVAALLAPEKF
jgi:K+-transporting ATPase KdpF subunit